MIEKLKSFVKTTTGKTLGIVAGVTAPGLAMADPAKGVDYTQITGQISWGGVTTAVLGICGGLAAVYVAMRGAKMVLSILRGR
ncbi:hypothetical protein [Burkholderia cenocepacia]|uniref:hypothetical protein n=1 Tax=Burkholderia cenocepacia TaxID=95486 RepID=UPI002AB03534|nr:hypothetical protein [Burkholderia cenocepacia]